MHLLVSGIPGAGKSTFARWLGVEYSFHHVDIDFDRYPDASAWLKMPRVVVDWGFPPNCLPFVRDLVANGFSHWWFDGDRQAAH